MLVASSSVFAQGTTFTYQGRLDDGGTPANGSFDFTFTLYGVSIGGSAVAGPVTNAAVAVTNGLFTTTLDLGGNFSGADRWLEIAARTNGSGSFTTLNPRQKLTPMPYAITASNLSGTLAASQLSGSVALANLPTTILVTNGQTGLNLGGSFSGNGAGITNLNLYLNTGGAMALSGKFVLASSPAVGSHPYSVTTADVNGDGKPDLISANNGANTLTVLTNNGSGGFVLASSPAVGTGPESVVAADVTGDGKPDLISANNGAGTLTVLTNDGVGEFVLANTYAVGSQPVSVAAADFNGDSKVDLISANLNANTLTVMTNDGSGNFALSSTLFGTGAPWAIAAADVNGDGKIDLINGDVLANTLRLLTNNGTGGFALAATYSVSSRPYSVTAADVNGDGKVDLINVNYLSGTLTILTNNGSGVFALASSPVVGAFPHSVAPADVNGDGKVDLVSANYNASGTLTVLMNNGNGGFEFDSSPSVGNYPNSVVAVDLNSDGKVDLVSGNYLDNTLTVLFNTPAFTGKFAGDGSGLTSLNASSFASGTVADARLSSNVALLSASQIFAGANALTNVGNNFIGNFAGNGTGLTNLNASGLASGTVSDPRLPGNLARTNQVWLLGGNAGTTPSVHFVGTMDNQPLEIKVNGLRALRLEPTSDSAYNPDGISDGAPNVIEGSPGNFVASGVVGATIGGGGATNYFGSSRTNAVLYGSDYGTVGGGLGNTIAQRANASTIGGGFGNTIEMDTGLSVIAGGSGNHLGGDGSVANTIGGGANNTIAAQCGWATLTGGDSNTIGTNSNYSFIGGGRTNTISTFSYYASIVAGDQQSIGTNCNHSTIGGGSKNKIYPNSSFTTIAGGSFNAIGANSTRSTIGGGYLHTILNNAPYATIPGGHQNFAAAYAFAAVYVALATNQGAFVWSDSTGTVTGSINDNSVTFRASGGYRLFTGTGNSGAQLPPGATAWSALSDRNVKKDVRPLDCQLVLQKLSAVPVTQWHYQWEKDSDPLNVGPMAQDFKAAFYPGRDDKTISTLEFDGVALAAIQGLNEKVEVRGQKSEDRLQKLEAENAELKLRLEKLETLLNQNSK